MSQARLVGEVGVEEGQRLPGYNPTHYVYRGNRSDIKRRWKNDPPTKTTRSEHLSSLDSLSL